jgi:hypothetical protein
MTSHWHSRPDCDIFCRLLAEPAPSLSAPVSTRWCLFQFHHGLHGTSCLQGALEFDDVAGILIGPLEGFDFVVAGIYFRIGWQ